MKFIISGPENPVRESIPIPSSKSISNRMLIMSALSAEEVELQNLSKSDDTRYMQNALLEKEAVRDIGHAGTAMRFLTSYYAAKHGKVVLTGSERMKQRPLGPLVGALRELGADICYLENEGCPPLEIRGGRLRGGNLEVDGGISSQFISSLMMIAPVLPGGLHIHLTGRVVSATYIEMTLALMHRGGIDASFDGRDIVIHEGEYRFGQFRVESDWSGASYWYMLAALLPGSEIRLPSLDRVSLQGDAVLTSLYKPLGVESEFDEEGVVLRSNGEVDIELYRQDFTLCPDLAQTMACTLCSMGIPFYFSGTRTLRVKETDRIAALQRELGKLGFTLQADEGGDWLGWDGTRKEIFGIAGIETYHDHRMAMAFAPMAAKMAPLSIMDPGVVSKSYPGFWKDLEKAGFSLKEG